MLIKPRFEAFTLHIILLASLGPSSLGSNSYPCGAALWVHSAMQCTASMARTYLGGAQTFLSKQVARRVYDVHLHVVTLLRLAPCESMVLPGMSGAVARHG